MKFKALLLLLLALFAAGVSLGFYTGRHLSYDFSRRDTARLFFAVHSQWTRLESPGDAFALPQGRLTLQAGSTLWSFRTGDNEVHHETLPALAEPAPRISFSEDFDRFAPLAFGPDGLFALALQNTREARIGRLLSLPAFQLLGPESPWLKVIATFSGFSLGLSLGQQPPAFDSPAFREAMNDVNLWQQAEKLWRGAYAEGVYDRFMGATPPPVVRKIWKAHPEIETQIQSDPVLTRYPDGADLPPELRTRIQTLHNTWSH